MCFIFCAGSPGPGRRQASETRAEASSAPTNHAAGSEEDSRGVSLPPPWEVGVAWLSSEKDEESRYELRRHYPD